MSLVGDRARDEAVIWHDVECGAYDADLPLWRELAGAAPGPVLEIGCGTGRVAMHLARCGHDVTAIDTDPALAAALEERARRRGLDIAVSVTDARALDVDGPFGLIAAPMQVLQLLPGAGDRQALLAGAAERLATGGMVALSIVEGVPEGFTGQPPHSSADAYLIHMMVHDAHHRGQILLAPKTSGYSLPNEDAMWGPWRGE